MENGVYTSLDIGTTSIKVIVAEVLNGQMNVIGVGSEKSKGLNRGMIVDIDETVTAIQQAVRQAEEKSGLAISQLIVGVPASGLDIEPCHGVVAVKNENQEITDEDVRQVAAQSLERAVPPEKEIVSVMVEEFVVDGFDGIKDPRGMVGVRLELYGTLLSTPKTILHNIRTCVEKAGFDIQDLVLQPQAIAQLALNEDERSFGTVQIDMGGGQTTVSAIHDDQVKFAHIEQEGGEYVSKDISIVLNTSIQNAEKLKRDVGYSFAEHVNEERTIQVDVVGQKEPISVKEEYIAEIIEARNAQIFEKIKAQLNQIRALELPGGIKLTGGAAAIPGIQELAEDIFEVQVELYIPDFMGVRYPSFTNAIGLAYYEAELNGVQRSINYAMLHTKGIGQQITKASEPKATKANVPNESGKKVERPKEDTNPTESVGEKVKRFFSTFFD
jgi:cell division protein FtsA